MHRGGYILLIGQHFGFAHNSILISMCGELVIFVRTKKARVIWLRNSEYVLNGRGLRIIQLSKSQPSCARHSNNLICHSSTPCTRLVVSLLR
jgi:hypothetical protein